jgi:hypothetical protein
MTNAPLLPGFLFLRCLRSSLSFPQNTQNTQNAIAITSSLVLLVFKFAENNIFDVIHKIIVRIRGHRGCFLPV